MSHIIEQDGEQRPDSIHFGCAQCGGTHRDLADLLACWESAEYPPPKIQREIAPPKTFTEPTLRCQCKHLDILHLKLTGWCQACSCKELREVSNAYKTAIEVREEENAT